MKNTQRLFAMLLAVAMVLSMAVTAFADDTPPDPASIPSFTALENTANITIVGAASGTQYTIYRIFDIAKLDETNTANPKHVFITNTKWAAFAEAESAKENGFFKISNDYLKTITIKDNATDAEKQAFAKAVIDYAKEHNIAYDGQSDTLDTSGTYAPATPYQYGYYVLVSSRSSTDPQYSLFVLDNNGAEVKEKNSAVVTLQKYVQEDSKIGDGQDGWYESNAAEIGQAVHFKIVLTAAAGTDHYTIEDTMNGFEELSDITAYYSNGAVVKGEDWDFTKDETSGRYVIEIIPSFRSLLKDGQWLQFSYTAKLKPNAVIAGNGNPNKAILNSTVLDEDGDPVTTKVGEDSTVTYTYKLIVKKLDETGAALAGATFTLTGKDGPLSFTRVDDTTNYIVDPKSDTTEITTDATGTFSINGLDSVDEYVLNETKAPEGYILMDPETIILDPSNNTHERTVEVTNLPGVDMPETGGMGTTIIYAVGGLMVLAAVVLLVTKKRMAA